MYPHPNPRLSSTSQVNQDPKLIHRLVRSWRARGVPLCWLRLGAPFFARIRVAKFLSREFLWLTVRTRNRSSEIPSEQNLARANRKGTQRCRVCSSNALLWCPFCIKYCCIFFCVVFYAILFVAVRSETYTC